MKANTIIAIILIVICSLGVYICVKEFNKEWQRNSRKVHSELSPLQRL